MSADCVECGRGMCAWCLAVEDYGVCCCGDHAVLPDPVEDDITRAMDEDARRAREAMRRAS